MDFNILLLALTAKDLHIEREQAQNFWWYQTKKARDSNMTPSGS